MKSFIKLIKWVKKLGSKNSRLSEHFIPKAFFILFNIVILRYINDTNLKKAAAITFSFQN